MQLSERTVHILKNFSSINQSILVRHGNILRTVSTAKTVVAKATVAETFERDFGIYDLPRFLGVLSLFDKPTISLGEQEATISSGSQTLVYRYAADVSTFITPPNKDLDVKDASIQFLLKAEVLQKVMRAGSILMVPELAFVGDGKSISVTSADAANEHADAFSVAVAETDLTFKATLKVDYLKLLPSDYDVSVSNAGIVRFSAPDLTYWVALEKNASRF